MEAQQPGAASLTDRLARFFDAIMESVWQTSDPDGGEIQNIAEKLRLIERVGFNPDVHEDHYGIGLGAGDDWFQLAPDARAAISKAEGKDTDQCQ